MDNNQPILIYNGGNKHEFTQKEIDSFCVFYTDGDYCHVEDVFFILC